MVKEITCPVCGCDIINNTPSAHTVLLDGQVEYICKNCYYQNFYLTDRRCEVCNKISLFPNFVRNKNRLKLLCSTCEKLYDKTNNKR